MKREQLILGLVRVIFGSRNHNAHLTYLELNIVSACFLSAYEALAYAFK